MALAHQLYYRFQKLRVVILSLFLLISVWCASVNLFSIPEYLVPSPAVVYVTFVQSFDYLFGHLMTTVAEAIFGFFLAMILGFLFGGLLAVSRIAESSFLPLFVGLQAVPIVALAPLFVLWFGSGIASKIGMVVVLCIFPVIVGTLRGLKSVIVDHMRLMMILNSSTMQTFWKLRLPASVPALMGGIKVSASLAMIGAIVAEYAGADSGLGYVIMQSTYRLETPLMFAAIILSALAGLLLFGLASFFEKMALAHFTEYFDDELY